MLVPLDVVPSPSGDINVASVQQFTLSSTGNLPIVSPPQQTFTVRWWLNGRPLNDSSSSYMIDSQTYNLRLLSVMYQDGGIYQAEVTIPGSSVTFRNFVVRRKLEYMIPKLIAVTIIISSKCELGRHLV